MRLLLLLLASVALSHQYGDQRRILIVCSGCTCPPGLFPVDLDRDTGCCPSENEYACTTLDLGPYPACCCSPGYVRNSDTGKCEPICENDGVYHEETASCECAWGFGGDRCQTSICLQGGSLMANLECACPPGYEGVFCERKRCQNGGSYDENSDACLCAFGYIGEFCEVRVMSDDGTQSPAAAGDQQTATATATMTSGGDDMSSATASDQLNIDNQTLAMSMIADDQPNIENATEFNFDFLPNCTDCDSDFHALRAEAAAASSNTITLNTVLAVSTTIVSLILLLLVMYVGLRYARKKPPVPCQPVVAIYTLPCQLTPMMASKVAPAEVSALCDQPPQYNVVVSDHGTKQ